MLFKKELATIEPLGYQKRTGGSHRYTANLKVIELPRSGRIIVVDFYEVSSKKLLVRFFSDGKSYLTCTEWPTDTWTKRNPRTICGEWSAYATNEAKKPQASF